MIYLIQLSTVIPELKDRYFVDKEGNLYTDYGKKKMNNTVQYKGYIRNGLSLVNNTTKRFFRHRLVLSAYKPVENMNELQVNHIDGNKLNNKLNNLEWCSCKENIQHACENDLISHQIGETNPFHKLTEKEVLEIIDDLKNHIPYSQLTEKYNCSKSTISSIKNHRNWSYLTKDIDFD